MDCETTQIAGYIASKLAGFDPLKIYPSKPAIYLSPFASPVRRADFDMFGKR
jgi:hypothetical protein